MKFEIDFCSIFAHDVDRLADFFVGDEKGIGLWAAFRRHE